VCSWRKKQPSAADSRQDLSSDIGAGLSGERFAREVRLAASLQHPNIVPVLTAGITDGVPYYTIP